MNIGIFTDTFRPVTNGVVDAVWRVCKGFQKEGHEVHLFALSDRDNDEMLDGVYIHRFKGKQFKFYPDLLIKYSLPLRRVFKLVNQYKIEVIHSNVHLVMGFCALMVSMKKKLPLISTFHTLVPEFLECFIAGWAKGGAKKPTFLKILEKLRLEKFTLRIARKLIWWWMCYFNTAQWLIVPSKYTKKILIEHGMSKEKIIVVPNPVNATKNKNVKKKKNMILHVGRLSPEKKVETIVKSLKYVKHDFNMVITSDGPMMDYLKDLAVKEGVADKVKFTGFVSRKTLDKYYDQAELFATAAEFDTFNNCVAEAVTHNLPVIINSNSGATDFVTNGKNGIIIKKDDPREYAKKIDWLLFNSDVREALSKAGDKIKEYTSIENITKKIEDLYTNFNKSSRWRKLKDFMIYSVGAAFCYSVIMAGSIFERDSNK